MAGINLSGQPQTKDYSLGRGAAYLAPLTDGLPGAYRHLGNAPEFNISVEVETLEHQSSLHGLKVTDKQVIISQKLSVTFSLDEVNAENVAVFLSGETAVYANAAAVAGFAEQDAKYVSVELGRWYDITTSTGERVYNIDSADVTLEMDDTLDVLLVEGTDYELDLFAGRFLLLADATNVAAGDDVNVTLGAKADAGTVDEVKALTQTNVISALKFIGENPANNDEQVEYQFHQISLKPTGDFALISDDFTKMQLTGVAETNTDADADSPTLTIRSLTPA